MLAFIISMIAPLALGYHWYQTDKGILLCQWWFARSSSILSLQITQNGHPQKTTTLFTANHISFLDIIVIASTTPARFLSKQTLRHWPIIGFITSSAGTIFIKRGNRQVIHKTIQTISTALEQQHSLIIFPEGTTTLGDKVKKFHNGLFQAAINKHVPVQPIALKYIRNGKPDRIAAYIDKDNFIMSLIKIMAQSKIEVQLSYCSVLQSQTYTRSELAKDSHAIINEVICRK